ncbi:MAG: prepilin peptidase [Ruminiclostridium sp.]|nr:prepilin peptidase [Ruminiclostridium sp.]
MLILKVVLAALIGLLVGYLTKYYAGLVCLSGSRLCSVRSCCLSCKNGVPIKECFKQIVLHKSCVLCGRKLSFKYHFIEICEAVIFVTGAVFIIDDIKLVIFCVLTSLLTITSVVDIELMKIPYFCSIGVFAVGMIVLIISLVVGSNWWKNQLLGAAFIAVLFIIPTLFGKAGGGDFQLLVAWGFVLGVKGIVIAVLVTIVVGFCRSLIAVLSVPRPIIDRCSSMIKEVCLEWYDKQKTDGVALQEGKTDTIYFNIINEKVNADETCCNIAQWSNHPDIIAFKELIESSLEKNIGKMAVAIKLSTDDSITLNPQVNCKRIIALAPCTSVGILVSYLLCI